MTPDGGRKALGHKEDPFYVEVKESLWTRGSVIIASLALLASIWAVAISVAPWGEVQPIEPSSYGILREDPLVGEVEHLIVPLEWKNDKGRTVLIRSPQLFVCEVGADSQCKRGNDGEPHAFRLTREYPDISGRVFADESYTYKSSLVLEPHSVSTNVLAFRLRLEEVGSFQFESDTEYLVTIDYLQDEAPDRIAEPLVLGYFCLKGKETDMTETTVKKKTADWGWWSVAEYEAGCHA